MGRIEQVFEGRRLRIELFNFRCSDIGEPVSVDDAKLFNEEISKRNSQKNSINFNLSGMRLGVQSMIALHQNLWRIPHVRKLNLSDNQITDNGMG